MAAYMVLQKYGTWPAGGASEDQAAWFMDAVAIADSERARIQKEEDDARRRMLNG